MNNEEITHELLLKFKGIKMGAKIPLAEQIKDIVGDPKFDTTEAIQYIEDSGYFVFLNSNVVTLSDDGFEYANRMH
ncbi:hypothetical protein [Flavobacterium chilense]|uniref:Uncharacterized protein n=1 Tax=Flavobacterium chilense TaxID=946677 RepID=A0A1M6XLX8_9FLAO|nr:hypothetical protein [Flavobacterium chilense]SHL06977.1 hypothetical protein SAMN05444484_101192 [Flavobacterium chilense]